MKLERIVVREKSFSIDVIDLFDEKSFDEAKLALLALENKYSPYIEQGKIVKFEAGWYGYDGSYGIEVVVYRWETDKELASRQAEQDAADKKREAAAARKKERALKVALAMEQDERKEYERLKAKFEQ